MIKALVHSALFPLLIALAGASCAQVPQIERDALIALYNSTDGANWTDNTGWLGETGTECSWFGVTCSSGSVSQLYFYRNGLNGTIPSELGNLTNLTSLNLLNNYLSGSIPSELSNLTNLINLDLAHNSFSGSISASFGNLTKLTYLSLYDNSLSGTIPKELGNLTNLTGLHFHNNSLSGTIPTELGNLTKLTDLNLYNNSLSGSIPSELSNLTNLINLDLAHNSFSGSVPRELASLTELATFSASGNSLTGSIPDGMGSQSTSKISSVERSALIALYNSTNGANWKDNFGWMGSAGTECFWSEVTCSSGVVTQLNLYDNSLTGTIPAELGNLSNLTYLFLAGNSLSGIIPSELGNLSNLTYLTLKGNSLSGSVPASFGNLTKLTYLSLYDNSLSGTIPKELGNLTNLTGLDLRNNSLSGTIPSELGNLTNLTTFLLNNNELSRPKPASLNSFTINNNAFEADADKDGIDDGIDTDRTSAAMIQNIIGPDYSLSILGSGRVVNLVSKSLFNETSGALTMLASTQITKILYSHFKDDFDFIVIAANNKECCSDAGYYGRFSHIQNDIVGLGKLIFDSTGDFGSAGKLQGIIHFPSLGGLFDGPGLHEILHNWGNNLIATEVRSHWGYSNVGGQLGGWQPNSLVALNDGTYQTKGPLDTQPGGWGSFANGGNGVPYSNLELYIMGLIGANEVGHDIKIAQDFKWVDSSNGIFEASSIKTLTMDQIIAENGIREPNHSNSQKNFQAMHVVVSEFPMSREDWRVVDKFVYDFQLKGSDGNPTYNFWEATQGKATMTFGQTDTFLKTEAISSPLVDDSDVEDESSTNTATITADKAAADEIVADAAEEWPAPYSGVTPDTSLGLAFNNIGVVDEGDGTIYTCLRVFTNGAPAPINGISQFDVGLKIVSSTDATVQITKSRAFNAISALNEDGQLPDCSGVFETTTGLYTDIIQSGTTVLDTKWNLIDPKQLILKLESAQELRAN